MVSAWNHLILKANRILGAHLAREALIPEKVLSEAYSRFLDCAQTGDIEKTGLLKILIYELGALNEETLLCHVMETCGIPYLPLRNFEGDKSWLTPERIAKCRATWTVPFDYPDRIPFLASAYYLSTPVRECWKSEFENEIHWYAARLEDIENAIHHLDASLLAEKIA